MCPEYALTDGRATAQFAYSSIQTTGTGDSNPPPLPGGCADLGKNGTVSPLSVSIKSKDAGTSPTTINLADDLISILAAGENVWPMCAPLWRCQLVGLR